MLLSLLLAFIISLPGIWIRWVYLQRPVKWFIALAIAAPTWLVILWVHHASVESDQPPAFISLGGIFLFMALVAPLKKPRTFPPKLLSPELPPVIPEGPLQLPPKLENSLTVTLGKDIREDDAQAIIKSIEMLRGVLSATQNCAFGVSALRIFRKVIEIQGQIAWLECGHGILPPGENLVCGSNVYCVQCTENLSALTSRPKPRP